MKRANFTFFLCLCLSGLIGAWAASPSGIDGDYQRQHKVTAYDSATKTWSEPYEVSDVLHLRSDGEFCFLLNFTNGHQCQLDGKAMSNGNSFLYSEKDSGSGDPTCHLEIQVSSVTIALHDPSGVCQLHYCGTRGVIEGIEFSRDKKSETKLSCGPDN